MFINRIVTLLAALKPVTVQAHCDTAEGPAVKARWKHVPMCSCTHRSRSKKEQN